MIKNEVFNVPRFAIRKFHGVVHDWVCPNLHSYFVVHFYRYLDENAGFFIILIGYLVFNFKETYQIVMLLISKKKAPVETSLKNVLL